MDITIDRYLKHDGYFGESYTYCAKIGTITLESPNILDLEVFISLNGYTTKCSFIDEGEYE